MVWDKIGSALWFWKWFMDRDIGCFTEDMEFDFVIDFEFEFVRWE